MKSKKKKIEEALQDIERAISMHYAMMGHPDCTSWKEDKILYKPFATIRKEIEEMKDNEKENV